MKRNTITTALTLFAVVFFVGCAGVMEEIKANKEKAAKVRFISEKESEGCEYLGEISVEQTFSQLGGWPKTEELAKNKLQMNAVTRTNGGNALRITDREKQNERANIYQKSSCSILTALSVQKKSSRLFQ